MLKLDIIFSRYPRSSELSLTTNDMGCVRLCLYDPENSNANFSMRLSIDRLSLRRSLRQPAPSRSSPVIDTNIRLRSFQSTRPAGRRLTRPDFFPNHSIRGLRTIPP